MCYKGNSVKLCHQRYFRVLASPLISNVIWKTYLISLNVLFPSVIDYKKNGSDSLPLLTSMSFAL